jgi:hypothetical protein
MPCRVDSLRPLLLRTLIYLINSMTFTESVSLDLQRSTPPTLKSPFSFPHPFSAETQFVIFCLRDLFWLDDFDNLEELEEAILGEDVYDIFGSNVEAVRAALKPFVGSKPSYPRYLKTRQKEGIQVYFVPVLEKVEYGYRETKKTKVKINLTSTFRT